MREPANPSFVGEPADLIVEPRRAADLRADSSTWPSWTLAARQLCDLELLIMGGFSPLRGFMTRREYESVCRSMRLPDGRLWPIPVVLTVSPDTARELESNRVLALRDAEGRLVAALHVEEMWQRDQDVCSDAIDRRTTPGDWGVDGREPAQQICVAGRVEALELPVHYDYVGLRQTPRQVRSQFAKDGWNRVMAFITDRPLHRADVELTPLPPFARTRPALFCFRSQESAPAPVKRYATRLSRENFGCSDVLIDRTTEAGDSSIDGVLPDHEREAGIHIVPARRMVYVSGEGRYRREDEVPPDAGVLRLSSNDLQRHMNAGEPLPAWFTFPAVATELLRAHPPKSRQGFTVFFTGLSGAGKSTIANMLLVRLFELGRRPVSLLDGDIVRQHLTSELGFSRTHRDLNVQRIAFVASEITRCGGVALCAAIAPYNAARRRARRMIEAVGGFLLVHVATPLEVCEERDAKGLYAKARRGALPHFTGISDPYEVPADADIQIDTTRTSAEEAARLTVSRLVTLGYLNDGEEPPPIGAV